MTTIPFDGTAVPDLPPLPIGALVACALDLMRETGDLPQPRYISIHQSAQALALQFAPETASLNSVATWAARFGGILVSSPVEAEHGSETWCRTDFDYYGVALHVYALIPVTVTGSPEGPEHADYPHEPGRLYGCPACEAACHCTPGDAECVYAGPHNGQAATDPD
jgi:hypothetical protein